MAVSDAEFRQVLLTILRRSVRAAKARVRPNIPSKVLRENFFDYVDERNLIGWLSFPHYWAYYVEHGRGPIHPRRSYRKFRGQRGKLTNLYLVWFKDPKKDPRTNYGTDFPYREKEWRKRGLTKDQFLKALKAGDLVVAKSLPAVPGKHFLRDSLLNFEKVMDELALESLESWLRRRGMKGLTEERRIRVRLG